MPESSTAMVTSGRPVVVSHAVGLPAVAAGSTTWAPRTPSSSYGLPARLALSVPAAAARGRGGRGRAPRAAPRLASELVVLAQGHPRAHRLGLPRDRSGPARLRLERGDAGRLREGGLRAGPPGAARRDGSRPRAAD